MARVYFVKKAMKDNPAVKKGEPYYHWTPYRSSTRYSAKPPRPSQLCSGKKSEVMAAQETAGDALNEINFDKDTVVDDLTTIAQECADSFRELGEQYRESKENIPENLQEGEMAQNMEQMADSLEEAASNLESLDLEFNVEKEDYTEDGKLDQEAYDEACNNWMYEKRDDIQAEVDSVEILF